MQRPYDALRMAVSFGEAAEVEKVLASGTWDLDNCEIDGYTPLHSAILAGHLDIVKVLLAHGADPNVRAKDGLPPLTHAVDLSMPEIVDVLLEHGAKLAAPQLESAGEPLAAAWLIFSDRDLVRTVPLTPPGVTIGRDPEQCDVALKDFGISRRHARIDVRPDGQMTLTDLKSKGGSQVNRVPVVEAPLTAGDRLLLGTVAFVVVGSLSAAPREVKEATPELREPSAVAAPPAVSLEEKLAWIDGICARVAAAHDKGVVHGDLHDGRIRTSPDGGVEVDLSPKSGPVLSLSPEQLRGGPADARSDVFAVACIAYRILTGRPPFEGKSLHALTYRVLHEDPADPLRFVPSLPDALAAWLRRGLAKEPAERFADAREMLKALHATTTPTRTRVSASAAFGRHGVVGGNLFLLAYVVIVTGPFARVLATPSLAAKWAALAVILVAGLVTVASIRAHGGGGAGEPLGALAGVLAWLGRLAGPVVGSRLGPASTQSDLWRVAGSSILPVLMALTLWLVNRGERTGR